MDVGFWTAGSLDPVNTLIYDLRKATREFREDLWCKYFWDTEFYWATHWHKSDEKSDEEEAPARAGGQTFDQYPE